MKQKKHALSLLTVALITSISILITSPTLCAAAPAWPPDIQDDKLDPEVSETANRYLVKRAGDACIAAYTSDESYSVQGANETYRTGTAWAYYSLGSEGTKLLPSLESTSTNIAGVAQFMYGDFHDCNISDLMRLGGSVSQDYLLDYVKAHASDVERCDGDTPSGTRDGCTNTTRWILLTNSGTPLDNDDQTAEQLREMLNRTDYDNVYLRGSYISQIASQGVIGGAPQMDKVSWYLVWSHALSQCGEVKAGYPVDSYGEGKAISIDWVSGDIADNEYKKIDAALVFNDGVDASTRVPVWPERTETCENIAKEVSSNTDAYIEAINKHLAETGDEVIEGDMEMDTSTAEDEEDPCQAGFLGFGWLFCPGANLIESFMNGFLNWIDDQLNWTMLAENDGAIRERWQDFLNIANIAFAIAFLVMIYSMATSTGLSNYDIKKMLPRLIVVAIAVNLSFYICAAIVDIFNIVGNSIYGIIVPGGDKWAVSDVSTLYNIGANIIAIIGVLFIFGISAIVALVVIFVCLCVREIALITLVVISPLAFVCYLLPNTQKWFQRWADYFIRLLMVYPMFMAVWGAAKWVASLKGDVTTGSKDAVPGFVVNYTCMIAPAIAIIPLFKMSGGIMGMAASRAAGSKLAARGQAAQSYMRGKGLGVAKNNVATRAISGRLSNRLGQFGADNATALNGRGIPGIIGGGFRRWAGRKALAASNALNKNANAIESELSALDGAAMETAKSNISNMSHDDLISIATTGMLNGNEVDQYTMRAATDAVAESMDEGQVRDMMLRRAQRARALADSGRASEARALLNNAADAASKSGSYLGNKQSLQAFRNGEWTGDSIDYSNAIANKAASLSPQALSNMSRGAIEHMRNEIANTTDETHDRAVQNLQAASAAIQDDDKMLSSMSSNAIAALDATNQAFRTASQTQAASDIELDSTLSNLNSNNQADRDAAVRNLNDIFNGSNANTINNLSHYDQRRLERARRYYNI